MKTIESLKNYTSDISLRDFSKMIKSDINFIYTKFGDGEYLCMQNKWGKNCDGDKYHRWLGKALQNAFIEICEKSNSYIGKWHSEETIEYLCGLAMKNERVPRINWVDYHFVMSASPIEGVTAFDSFSNKDLFNFVKEIQLSKRKKILLTNSDNKKIKDLFKADVFIETPKQNWSYDYEKYHEQVKKELCDDAIIITAAGLCSKVLISDMVRTRNITCIDIGSGFDLLATEKHSRPWKHTYQDELTYFGPLLPSNWNDY